uniref:R-spondin 4 n=1 Tax=Sphaeramia orbicularis TaxID=375764 RepID=A0A672ZDE5_9TELE
MTLKWDYLRNSFFNISLPLPSLCFLISYPFLFFFHPFFTPAFSPAAQKEMSEDCRSCLECSSGNGCVRCPERLFLFLQRDGMSHHGTCLHACPAGHYGQRGKDISRCMKCRSLDCEHCFSRDFCTKCKPGFQLYKGKCLSHCPEGTFIHQTDCFEDCSVAPLGEWSDWSICLRDGLTCGFRWGKQTRTRGRSQSGRTPEEQSLCPTHSETQKCRMKKKCPQGKAVERLDPIKKNSQHVLFPINTCCLTLIGLLFKEYGCSVLFRSLSSLL